jgi:hypothetical protein
LSQEEQEDIDFLADFLHLHKNFTNSLSSSNGQKMNMLGWRKCMKPDKKISIDLLQPKITRRINKFTKFFPVATGLEKLLDCLLSRLPTMP